MKTTLLTILLSSFALIIHGQGYSKPKSQINIHEVVDYAFAQTTIQPIGLNPQPQVIGQVESFVKASTTEECIKPNVSVTVENQVYVGELVLIKIEREKPVEEQTVSFSWQNFSSSTQLSFNKAMDTTFYSLLRYEQYKTDPILNLEVRKSGSECAFTYKIAPPVESEVTICDPEISVEGLKPFYCSGDSAFFRLSFDSESSASKPYRVYAHYQRSDILSSSVINSVLLGDFTGENLALPFDMMRVATNYYLVFE